MLHLKELVVNIIIKTVLRFMRAVTAGAALQGTSSEDGKAAASCRTPNKKRQPRLPLFLPSHNMTWKNYTTSEETGRIRPFR